MALDRKQVEVKGKELGKAVNAGEASTTILPLLEELRKGVQATEELLRSTRIGMIVNKLKTHQDPAVKTKAAEIVSKWRSDVKKTGSGGSTPRPAQNGTSSPGPGPSPAPPAKEKRKHHVPPDKRNAKSDDVDWQLTGSAMRDNAIKMMYDGLAFMSEELPEDILKVARDIESAAHKNFQPESSAPYKTKVRSLYMNLKNKSNPQLRERVFLGKISPDHFVNMKDEEMRSEQQKATDIALMKENMNKAMVAQEEKSVSAQLKCGKCGMRKVSYTQAQTRAADEPMTTFCECMNCGNRWKFS